MRYAETLERRNETEFGGHKRSLIVRRLEKLRNLVQEPTRYWSQITNEYYDFELLEFLNQRLNPASGQGTRLSIHLQAQGKAEGKADEEPSPGDAIKTAEEITDVRLYKASSTASSGARPIKDISEYEDTDVKL
ncbi:hypothetical protein NOF04DRAFT_1197537 [Fusarium oxysporum II5]|nr:hypothetical protein NOF04DRAFT_1197537 [Fusarium oxysporum II5]